MNETLAKLIALSIVGGVAKALFGTPRPYPATGALTSVATQAAETAAERVLKGVN